MAVWLVERGAAAPRRILFAAHGGKLVRVHRAWGDEFKRRVQERSGGRGACDARASHWPSTQQVTEILIRDGDSFEVALKRFTRKVQQAGVLSEAKRHMHYEPPSVKRKRKAENRARKERKARAKAAARGY